MTGEALIIAQEAEYFQTNNLIKPREGKAPFPACWIRETSSL